MVDGAIALFAGVAASGIVPDMREHGRPRGGHEGFCYEKEQRVGSGVEYPE